MAWGRKHAKKAGTLAALTLALGCSDEGDDPSGNGGSGATGGTPGAGGATACHQDGQIVINDSMNYSFSSTMTVESTVVKDAENLLFDWSAVTVDFFGAPVNAAEDIDLVLVSLWGMTETELAANLNADNLPLRDNKGAITFYPNGTQTSANLLDFDSFGTAIEEAEIWRRFDTSTEGYEFPPETHTFMLTAATGTVPGENSRMIGYFRLDPTATNTTVALTNSSTQMTWSAQLASAPDVPVPAGNPALTIDWSGMTLNAMGATFDGTQVTEVVVGHYATMTVPELEQQFLFLEDLADAWYWGEVYSGQTFDLSTLTERTSGAAFPGIDATGVWMVALFCTANCNNPAPWSITKLTPC